MLRPLKLRGPVRIEQCRTRCSGTLAGNYLLACICEKLYLGLSQVGMASEDGTKRRTQSNRAIVVSIMTCKVLKLLKKVTNEIKLIHGLQSKNTIYWEKY